MKTILRLVICVCFIILTPSCVFSQYNGGDADGFAFNSLSQTSCSPIFSEDQYLGGSADGFSSGLCSQTNCLTITANAFFGGNADGFAFNPLTQTSCSPVWDLSQYIGGNADGFSSGLRSQTNCLTITASAFLGGNADGFAFNPLTQSSCSPIWTNSQYFGGIADGFSSSLRSQTNCLTITASVFLGGNSDGFSSMKLSPDCVTLLPITLISFTATPKKDKVLCEWTTSSEINNDYFTLEKTKDINEYNFIAKVNGAGNSNQILNYSYIDPHPFSGISYYRLKQTDYNGNFVYSNLVPVNFDQRNNNFSVYPNPFHDQTNVVIDASVNLPSCKMTITNLLGNEVRRYSNIESHSFVIVRNDLADGIYYLKLIIDNDIVQTCKLIIL